MSALLPTALVVIPSPWPIWVGVGALGVLAGRWEGGWRRARKSASAAQPWAPAVRRSWQGAGLLRTTGWATAVRGNRWRSPAILLERRDPGGRTVLTPDVGSGVLITGKGAGPPPGSILATRLELRVPPGERLPGGFDYRRFLAGRGLAWTGRAESWETPERSGVFADGLRRQAMRVRHRILESLDRLLPDREAGLAGAVLMGVRGPDHRTLGGSFTQLGLAHLFAVSGLHVGILLGLFTLPGRLLGLGPGLRFLPLAVILPAYVLLTGMPGSVVRAAGLGLLALAGPLLGTRAGPLHLLGILFWAGCVWEPGQVLDTGLQLSYLAAGGILAVSGLTGGFRFSRRRIPGLMATGLAVSLAAQWFTLPVVAASFGRISLLSPFANLVVVPLFGVAVWLSAAGVVLDLVLPWGAEALGAGTWILFRLLAVGVEGVAGTSGGWTLGLPVPTAGGLILWGLLTFTGLLALSARSRGRRTRGALGVLALVVIGGLFGLGPGARTLNRYEGASLWVFDVDQGDCSLVVLPDGWVLMIDTGGVLGRPGPGAEALVARSVVPFLVREGIPRLDAVVLTHGHLDHTGGAGALDRSFMVGSWYGGGHASDVIPDSLAVLITPPPGRHLLHRTGPWEVHLLVPHPPEGTEVNENDFSLVTLLRHGSKNLAVLSGDLEREGEATLLEAGLVPQDVQVWKAGHHGSATSGSAPFMATLDPEMVVVSCGVGNRYGHPSHGPFVCGADTIPILRTDLHGSIRLRWSPEGIIEGFATRIEGVP